MKAALSVVLVCIAVVFVTGCPPKGDGTLHELPAVDYDRPLPAGQLALVKITDPDQIPSFATACRNTMMLAEAIDRSLAYLAKPSSRAFFPYGDISHDRAVASLKALRALLERNLTSEQMDQAIREQFDVYMSIGCDGAGTVLFTGYYTPIFDAATRPCEKFRYPLYRQPANLAKSPDGTTLGLRDESGGVSPCPARRELESSGMLIGNELIYLADPFEAYVAHVQGSAKLRLSDGAMKTIGYAANNGHEYKSVAMELINDGKLPRHKLSLQAMIEYFKANPDQVNEYVWRNPRYVFFTDIVTEPLGCLNEPVTPMRSIATDKSIFPRACLTLVQTKLPRRLSSGIEPLPFSGFMLDQDAGGAIRAPGRCDIYMGVGDNAAALAGRTHEEGRLYYLILKDKPVN